MLLEVGGGVVVEGWVALLAPFLSAAPVRGAAKTPTVLHAVIS